MVHPPLDFLVALIDQYRSALGRYHAWQSWQPIVHRIKALYECGVRRARFAFRHLTSRLCRSQQLPNLYIFGQQRSFIGSPVAGEWVGMGAITSEIPPDLPDPDPDSSHPVDGY